MRSKPFELSFIYGILFWRFIIKINRYSWKEKSVFESQKIKESNDYEDRLFDAISTMSQIIDALMYVTKINCGQSLRMLSQGSLILYLMIKALQNQLIFDGKIVKFQRWCINFQRVTNLNVSIKFEGLALRFRKK